MLAIMPTAAEMSLSKATVLITGANRGIGRAFAVEALARGARKVYAASRRPESIEIPGVTPLRLDVTSPSDALAAAAAAGDTTLLINNAGIAIGGGVMMPNGEDALRRHFETNVLGVLNVSRAFAPVLKRNGGGTIMNVASVASWVSSSQLGNYAVSKAAVWSLSNGLRHDLREQGTRVVTLHMGFVDTDLAREIDRPKSTPEAIVARAFDALEAGLEEILADAITEQVKQGLTANPPVYLQTR